MRPPHIHSTPPWVWPYSAGIAGWNASRISNPTSSTSSRITVCYPWDTHRTSRGSSSRASSQDLLWGRCRARNAGWKRATTCEACTWLSSRRLWRIDRGFIWFCMWTHCRISQRNFANRLVCCTPSLGRREDASRRSFLKRCIRCSHRYRREDTNVARGRDRNLPRRNLRSLLVLLCLRCVHAQSQRRLCPRRLLVAGKGRSHWTEEMPTSSPFSQLARARTSARMLSRLARLLASGILCRRCSRMNHTHGTTCSPMMSSSRTLLEVLGGSDNAVLSSSSTTGSLSERGKEG